MRVLIVTAHADDAEEALGGTMVRLQEEGHEIHYIAFSICEDSVPEGFPRDVLYGECLEATKRLGVPTNNIVIRRLPVRHLPEYRQQVLDELVAIRKRLDPGAVFAPSTADVHQDHATINAEVIRAFRRTSSIYGYDFPWNVLYSAKLDLFYELRESHLDKKIRALRAYKSQLAKEGNPLSEEYVRSLAIERGNRIGVKFAEAFEVIRELRKLP